MGSLSRNGAFLTALFAAILTSIIVSLITWELLLSVNNGMVVNSNQVFLALFSGFAFGLAVFSFVYASRTRLQ